MILFASESSQNLEFLLLYQDSLQLIDYNQEYSIFRYLEVPSET